MDLTSTYIDVTSLYRLFTLMVLLANCGPSPSPRGPTAAESAYEKPYDGETIRPATGSEIRLKLRETERPHPRSI
jgi:hypothetical protein